MTMALFGFASCLFKVALSHLVFQHESNHYYLSTISHSNSTVQLHLTCLSNTEACPLVSFSFVQSFPMTAAYDHSANP